MRHLLLLFVRAPAGGCESLRLTPGKALFLRRGAQTFCREEAPAAAGVCAPFPGKPYSSVEGRKPFAGKSRRQLREFAPHSRESLILPLRGANPAPGKGAGGCVSLRPIPRKGLFFRRGAQTFHPEKPRRLREFAPHSRESLILPSRGANPAPGKSPRRRREFAPHSRESLILPLRGANPSPGKAPGGCGSLRPIPGKALFLRRGAQTLHPEKPPAAVGVCAPLPGKPYSSVEGRKPFTREEPPPAA